MKIEKRKTENRLFSHALSRHGPFTFAVHFLGFSLSSLHVYISPNPSSLLSSLTHFLSPPLRFSLKTQCENIVEIAGEYELTHLKMAQELDDGEFWLPSEFLNDDDILMDFRLGKPNVGEANAAEKRNSGLCSLYGFDGFGSNSDLSSPVESVMGSTETESDDEEYLSGLTRKLARSTLYDDFWKPESNFYSESNITKATGVVAGSPQSTLCGCKQGSSRGSPNCPSPRNAAAAAARNRESSLDLLYAAAGEVARMRMVEEAASGYYKRNYLASQPPPRKTISLQYQQIQAAAALRQQQMMKQQQYHQMLQQNRTENVGGSNRAPAPAVALSLSAWPTLQQSQQPQQHQQFTQPQQQPGSGMRAVFLGNPSNKRECTGTGVFLPRQVGAPTEPRKKRGCSTVLLPDRVVQALNLNLEVMEAQAKLQSRCNGPRFSPDYDADLRYRTSVLMAQQRRSDVRQQPVMNELRLPQEWTY